MALSASAWAELNRPGAAIFSAVHYIGPFGDPFTVASFSFRFLFGLALNAIYLVRGFGIAAWTLAVWNSVPISIPW